MTFLRAGKLFYSSWLLLEFGTDLQRLMREFLFKVLLEQKKLIFNEPFLLIILYIQFVNGVVITL